MKRHELSKRARTNEPKAVYIHVPFCRHRCGYCNFTLVAGRDDLIADYLRAIELEIRSVADPKDVDTLFIGGGTPTHLPPQQLRELLSLVRRWFPPADNYEWTVEANPEDLDEATLAVLVEMGVNRLSLGVQSFDDEKLRSLDRQHVGRQVHDVLAAARSHFRSLAIDLIFAAPRESLASWQSDLHAASAACVDHVSCYGLTYEKGTRFWSLIRRGELQQLDEDLDSAMYVAAIDWLTNNGFEHYEVSNFARPGHRCRHNEVYWSGEPYFAFGPGAARYLNGRREVNHRSTSTYLRRMLGGESPVAESEKLPPEPAARERLVVGLRRCEGVDRRSFQEQTGFDLESLLGDQLPRLLEWGLLQGDGSFLRLTRRGLLVSDSIWPLILAPETTAAGDGNGTE